MTVAQRAALSTSLALGLKSLRPAAVRKIFSTAPAGSDGLEAWIGETLHPDDARIALERLARTDEFSRRLDELSANGITVLFEEDSEYPSQWRRLGDRRPISVFVAGEPQALSAQSIGIVGSRSADDDALAFARSLAREAVRLGFSVVSGAARGVDSAAMGEAVRSGGSAIGIASDSLLGLATKHRPDIQAGKLVLASAAAPQTPFSVGLAMSRNKLVYALARATVVVRCENGSGGTWAGAVESLRFGIGNVAVWAHAGPGAQALAERGAATLDSASRLDAILARESGTLFEEWR